MKDRFLKSNNSLLKNNIYLFLSFLLLIIFGFYKNGIMLYNLKYINFISIFKPIIMDIIGVSAGFLSYYIYYFVLKKNKVSLGDVFSSFYPFYGLLVASLIGININFIILFLFIFVIFFVSLFFNKKNYFNVVALCILIIILFSSLIGDYSFLNIHEINNALHFSSFDYFVGFASGGINSTSVILLIISFVFLSFDSLYKREIPVFACLTFFVLILLYGIFKNDVRFVLNSLLTNGVLFSYIYIATISRYSPCVFKGRIIYGVLIGFLTFCFYFVFPQLAALGAVFIASLCTKFIDYYA